MSKLHYGPMGPDGQKMTVKDMNERILRLKKKYPYINGLVPVNSFEPFERYIIGQSYVQIILYDAHWVAMSIDENKTVRICDSLKLTPSRNTFIFAIIQSEIFRKQLRMDVWWPSTQQQDGNASCGPIAVAIAEYLCLRMPPPYHYDENALCQAWKTWKNGKILPTIEDMGYGKPATQSTCSEAIYGSLKFCDTDKHWIYLPKNFIHKSDNTVDPNPAMGRLHTQETDYNPTESTQVLPRFDSKNKTMTAIQNLFDEVCGCDSDSSSHADSTHCQEQLYKQELSSLATAREDYGFESSSATDSEEHFKKSSRVTEPENTIRKRKNPAVSQNLKIPFVKGKNKSF